MNKFLPLLLLTLTSLNLCFSQSENKWKEAKHLASTSINYYPPFDSYSFFQTFTDVEFGIDDITSTTSLNMKK